MIGFETINKTIETLLNTARKAVPKINGFILACSLMQRPGLSTLVSAANITKELAKLGIPTGKNTDGTDNLIVASVIKIVDEIFRAIREDGVVESAILPGTLTFVGTGSNGGGPIVVTGPNVTTGEVRGLMH